MTDQPTQKKLADNPSDLIENALADLERGEHHEGYRINMGAWHRPDHLDDMKKTTCAVCLSGAVMAFSLEVSHVDSVCPNDFDEETRGKLCAINEFRMGGIADGLREMGLREAVDVDAGVDPSEGEDPRVTRLRRALGEALFWGYVPHGEYPPLYKFDRVGFKAYMHKMVQLFRKFGL